MLVIRILLSLLILLPPNPQTPPRRREPHRVKGWFQSYLHNRTQSVKIDDACSEPLLLDTGVPQGSVLGPLLFSLYMLPLGDVISRSGIKYHFYADDTQLYVSFTRDDATAVQGRLEKCIDDIKAWMSENRLLFNDSKTEIVVFSPRRHAREVSINKLRVGESLVLAQPSARNLGLILESDLSMSHHVTNLCRTAFYHLRCIARIRKYLSMSTTVTLVHAFVSSRLDSCNSLLIGLPNEQISKIQRVQNAAAKLVMKSKKFDHVTPLLEHLHWLPVRMRIRYKILLLVFKCLHGLGPSYLSELVVPYVPSRSLRSTDKLLLKDYSPKSSKCSLGDRAFQRAVPKLWNPLPFNLRSCQTVDSFKSQLKTHLFVIAFNT